MRIISWNVNGIRATHNKWELAKFILTYDPDIIFMQEIKCDMTKMPSDLQSPDPYITYYNPAEKPGYAGTGAWVHARVFEKYEISFFSSFPSDPTANEGRVAHIILKNKDGASDNLQPSTFNLQPIINIFGIYFPNGGKSEDAWKGKIVFYSEFAKYIDGLKNQGHAVLWGGDLNCAHQEIDLARPKENDGKIGFHPVERAWLDGRVSDGWSDIWRERHPTEVDVYSWWDPVTRSRERNVGWRIDAWWWESLINAKVRDIQYLGEQMGSDHCPMLIEIDI
jgi:exodeoxyribonuclease III